MVKHGDLSQTRIGLAGSLLIAGIAYRKGSLSKSGAIAAVVLRYTMYAAGALPGSAH